MLEKFRQIKLREIEMLEREANNGNFPAAWTGKRPSFANSLQISNGLPAVIAEYKRASPSKGAICDSVSASRASREFMENGASALSILTEREFFCGNRNFLHDAHMECEKFSAPILRKDFIFHPIQIAETATTPASALLLIVRMTPDAKALRNLREEAEKSGLECVVEVFDATELGIARESGARIIQVNARNLDTLQVNRSACLQLIKDNPPEGCEKWIAASGMEKREHLRAAASSGFHAALIGSFLMTGGQPGRNLRELLTGDSHAA